MNTKHRRRPVRPPRAALEAQRWIVDVAGTATEALDVVHHREHDAVLVAGGLPDMAAHEAVRRLRAKGACTPAVVPSASGRAADRVRAQNSIAVGPVTLDLGTREVHVHGRQVHLTGKEFAVMELLALRKGAAPTKEAFFDHLYGGMDEPGPKIVDVFVRKLDQAGAPRVIGTVRGRGYIARADRGRGGPRGRARTARPGLRREPGRRTARRPPRVGPHDRSWRGGARHRRPVRNGWYTASTTCRGSKIRGRLARSPDVMSGPKMAHSPSVGSGG